MNLPKKYDGDVNATALFLPFWGHPVNHEKNVIFEGYTSLSNKIMARFSKNPKKLHLLPFPVVAQSKVHSTLV